MSLITMYINTKKFAQSITDLVGSTTKNYGGCLARRTSTKYIESLISDLPLLKNITGSKDLKANKSQEFQL